MKKVVYLIIALSAVFMSGKVSAQGKFGADSAECIKYLSYYQEYYKQKNYDAALPNWRNAYRLCPASASQNMFIHGSFLMNREISKTRDAAKRSALVDTLLILQDQRLTNYPTTRGGVSQAPTILNNKGTYLIKYREQDAKYLYDNLHEIITELGGKAKANLLVYDLQTAIKLYRDDMLSADDVIAEYNTVVACIDAARAKNDEEAAENAQTKRDLESIFADSKVASCDNIISIFGPRFEQNSDDVALASSIVKLMNTADDCVDNDLYLKAVTSMHKNDPSAQSAYFLYKLQAARSNTSAAVSYLEEAIASSDETTKAQYLYELASFAIKNGMKAKAYDAARKTVECGGEYVGKAYYLIGNMWIGTACQGNEIERRAPYWVATDYFQKAKNADASLADDCNRMISQASAYYPQAAEAFMYDLSAGQSYTISCGGLSATTTVRVNR